MANAAAPRDYGWAAFAFVMAVLGVLGVVSGLWRALTGEPLKLVAVPIGIAFYYWFALGAWRRTVWGRPAT